MLDTQKLTKSLRDFLAEARQEAAAIDQRIAHATEVLNGLTETGSARLADVPVPESAAVDVAPRRRPGRPKGSKSKPKPTANTRRPMSAAMRREVSRRMTAYWASRREAKANT